MPHCRRSERRRIISRKPRLVGRRRIRPIRAHRKDWLLRLSRRDTDARIRIPAAGPRRRLIYFIESIRTLRGQRKRSIGSRGKLVSLSAIGSFARIVSDAKTQRRKASQSIAVTEHKHTNALANETSPYLLQHAHNPVDWHPWGDEALRKARAEDKPILLSIGYSACHWCHVMERESFENEAIAKLMNENFININVDGEERPDVDAIYMSAVQLLTGQGGWPMTMFLTPEGKPFYGGTYF